jgi:hypothetical protein
MDRMDCMDDWGEGYPFGSSVLKGQLRIAQRLSAGGWVSAYCDSPERTTETSLDASVVLSGLYRYS